MHDQAASKSNTGETLLNRYGSMGKRNGQYSAARQALGRLERKNGVSTTGHPKALYPKLCESKSLINRAAQQLMQQL